MDDPRLTPDAHRLRSLADELEADGMSDTAEAVRRAADLLDREPGASRGAGPAWPDGGEEDADGP